MAENSPTYVFFFICRPVSKKSLKGTFLTLGVVFPHSGRTGDVMFCVCVFVSGWRTPRGSGIPATQSSSTWSQTALTASCWEACGRPRCCSAPTVCRLHFITRAKTSAASFRRLLETQMVTNDTVCFKINSWGSLQGNVLKTKVQLII